MTIRRNNRHQFFFLIVIEISLILKQLPHLMDSQVSPLPAVITAVLGSRSGTQALLEWVTEMRKEEDKARPSLLCRLETREIREHKIHRTALLKTLKVRSRLALNWHGTVLEVQKTLDLGQCHSSSGLRLWDL